MIIYNCFNFHTASHVRFLRGQIKDAQSTGLICQSLFESFLNCLNLRCFPFQAHSKWFAGLLITLSVGWNTSMRSAAVVIPAKTSSSTEPWGSITSLQRRWSGTTPQIRPWHQRCTMSAAVRKGTQSKKRLWSWGIPERERSLGPFHEASLTLSRTHSLLNKEKETYSQSGSLSD